jgi:hypothetical protein
MLFLQIGAGTVPAVAFHQRLVGQQRHTRSERAGTQWRARSHYINTLSP